jgi:hypothetical protein
MPPAALSRTGPAKPDPAIRRSARAAITRKRRPDINTNFVNFAHFLDKSPVAFCTNLIIIYIVLMAIFIPTLNLFC